MTRTESIFRKYYKPLVYYVSSVIDNQQEAEDIAIDVIYRCKKYKGKMWGVLFTAAKNAIEDYRRAINRHDMSHKEMIYLNPDIDHMALEIQTDYINDLYAAIDKLPPQCRRVFKLYWYGMETIQIATRLHITPRIVLNQKTRAIGLLRAAMGQ